MKDGLDILKLIVLDFKLQKAVNDQKVDLDIQFAQFYSDLEKDDYMIPFLFSKNPTEEKSGADEIEYYKEVADFDIVEFFRIVMKEIENE